jgi:glycosyltransferase involved in cell wall biosynthesis
MGFPVNMVTTEDKSAPQNCRYVLMTAAYNEEAYIEKTLQSVIAQTIRPERWVIVSDSSVDRTDEIVQRYADQHDFIRFLRVTKAAGHSFRSKVVALHKGAPLLEGATYDFIGNVDADLSLEPFYFEQLLDRFRQYPDLGVAGGFVYEDNGRGFQSRWFNSVNDVGHAAQLVRRKCYEAIGGYAVLKYGGEDWYAQTCARMKGWRVEAMPDLKIFHHRHTGGGSHPLRNAFRQGKMDYAMGSYPAFEVIKCLRRFREKPYLIASLTRIVGFSWSHICGESRAVPDDVAAFLRQEQKNRVSSLLTRGRSGRAVALPLKNPADGLQR